MRGELSFPLETALSFVLVLARTAGALAFLPLPGFRGAPAMPRIVLAAGLALLALPSWPVLAGGRDALGAWMVSAVLSEAALGMAVALAAAFVLETFVLAMQMLGMQAGYAYASMIDPATEADSSVLQVVGQLSGALLFVAFGWDRELLRLLAASLDSLPPGQFPVRLASAGALASLGADLFKLALRMALPMIALMLLVDLAMALLGRINAQLQLLMLAFPVKMLAAMAILAALAGLWPTLLRAMAQPAFACLRALLERGG